MVFDVGDSKVAGSMSALLAKPSTLKVLSAFGDGCQKCYNVDIRKHKNIMNTATVRSVASFIKYYGTDDALKIMRQLFSPIHNGKYQNRPIGAVVFSKRWRWFTDSLLLECADVDDDISWSRI